MIGAAPAPDTDILPPRGGHTVVCLDDDPATLAALRRALQREPYEFMTTDLQEEALRWLRFRRVSLMVCDLRMPERTGLGILDEARKLSPGTTFVILTGYAHTLLLEPGPRPWIRDLLEKPWDDQRLKQTIRLLLREREMREVL